jgi:hypothetical protein
MGAEVAIGDRSGQRVDEGVAEDIAVGMGVEPDVRVNRDAPEDQLATWNQSVDVVADARAEARHTPQARRSSIVRARRRRTGSNERVASCTGEPGG